MLPRVNSSIGKYDCTGPDRSDIDLAVAHWGKHCNGGGDRVAWELARCFDSPLYVGYRDESIEPEDDLDVRDLFGSGLSGWLIERGGLAQMLAYQLCWQTAMPLREYDVLVTSGNEPLFYVAPDDQPWIAYIHHTNRNQSDLIHEVGSGLRGMIKKSIYYAMRVAYDHNTQRPDLYVVNSELVGRRLERYWGIDSEDIRVVYPPIDTGT